MLKILFEQDYLLNDQGLDHLKNSLLEMASKIAPKYSIIMEISRFKLFMALRNFDSTILLTFWEFTVSDSNFQPISCMSQH